MLYACQICETISGLIEFADGCGIILSRVMMLASSDMLLNLCMKKKTTGPCSHLISYNITYPSKQGVAVTVGHIERVERTK